MKRLMQAMVFSLVVIALPAQAVTLKIATLAPDGNNWMNQMRAGAADVEKRTQGRVTFKFYPGGVMGSDKSVMRKIRVGQLHGGAVTSGVLGDIYPDSQIYSFPLLFENYDEINHVRAKFDAKLIKNLEKKGFVAFGLSDGGLVYLMTNEPVRAIEDLRNKKIWVPEGDEITRAVFVDMGITPIQLPVSDVYTGLQTGLIDTVGISPIGALAFQWHTKTRYLTDNPLMYLSGVLIVSQKAFSKIQPGDQAIVREVFGDVFTRLNLQNQKDNLAARGALQNHGIQFVKLNPGEWGKLNKHVLSATSRLRGKGEFSPGLLQSIKSLRDDYRSKHRTAKN